MRPQWRRCTGDADVCLLRFVAGEGKSGTSDGIVINVDVAVTVSFRDLCTRRLSAASRRRVML
jgi:hypothetical protein